MNDRTHTDALRDTSTDLAEQLDELADALDAGDATGDDVRECYRMLAATMVELEDAGSMRDVIDDTTSRSRAIDEARRAIYQLSTDDGSPALTSLVAAAEHTEAAYSAD